MNTYIILLLMPSSILLFPVKKINGKIGVALCFMINIGWYFVGRINLPLEVPGGMPGLTFVVKELKNLMNVLPYFWIGAFLCKGKVFDRGQVLLEAHVPEKMRNIVLVGVWTLIFFGSSILKKTVLVTITSFITSFLIFNLLRKSKRVKRVFLFLGKHSTNIWLTHMFFYLVPPFAGAAQIVKYPIAMFLFLLVLCIAASYAVMGIDKGMKCFVSSTKRLKQVYGGRN